MAAGSPQAQARRQRLNARLAAGGTWEDEQELYGSSAMVDAALGRQRAVRAPEQAEGRAALRPGGGRRCARRRCASDRSNSALCSDFKFIEARLHRTGGTRQT